MLGQRKLNQIENVDWNNSNDSESEIEAVQNKLLKDRSWKILMNVLWMMEM